MEQTKEQLLNRLMETADTLAPDKLQQAVDFVDSLRPRGPGPATPARGSARAVLRHAGAFQAGDNELTDLLADISRLRELDLERSD